MATVTKIAYICGIGEAAPLVETVDGEQVQVPTMTLSVLLGRGTPGEQRQSFMVLQQDYTDLDSPSFNDQVAITLSTGPDIPT